MSKIWLVSEGEYSDFHIVGAFSSLEKAEAFARHFYPGRNPEHVIEEREIDPMQKEMSDGYRAWRVLMRIDSAEVVYAQLHEGVDKCCSIYSYPGPEQRPIGHQYTCLLCTCWARNDQHAIKIAAEKRLQWIVEQDKKPHAQKPPAPGPGSHAGAPGP